MKISNKNLNLHSKLIIFLVLVYIAAWQITLNLLFDTSKCKLSQNIYDTLQSTYSNYNKTKIFCIILTHDKKLATKAKLVHDSWAQKCDKFKFVLKLPENLKIQNNKIVYENQLIGIDIDDLFEPPGIINDTYRKLTDKVFLTYKHLYLHNRDYDWYFKADDDTFVFVDNLRKFLSDKNPSEPISYGYLFNRIVPKGYHSGGAGYVLSNEALSRIGAKLVENYKFCPNRGLEDVDVAKCLRLLNVNPGNSLDHLGKERFHPLSIKSHYYGTFPKWLVKYSTNTPVKGLQCCSDETITFHYVRSDDFKKLTNMVQAYDDDKSTCKKPLRFIDIAHQILG